MKSRTIIAGALAAFVVAGLGLFIAREIGGWGLPGGAGAAGETEDEGPALPRQVVVYFFHGAVRCDSCRRIEAWARRVTGVLFVLVGLYYCLAYLFGLTWFRWEWNP